MNKHAPKSWPILVVDDEKDVHTVTKLALRDQKFFGAPLEFVDANSGAEACDILARRSDFALALVDVVMETDDAGLEVVRFIRETMENQSIRVLLRSGHLGEGTEILAQYDIDGFMSKTELTNARLFGAVHTAIRTHQLLIEQECYIDQLNDLINELQRLGLQMAADITDPRGLISDESLVMSEYIKGLVQQLRERKSS